MYTYGSISRQSNIQPETYMLSMATHCCFDKLVFK